MKKINKSGSMLFAAMVAIGMLFSACDQENITKETYTYPDVYVALIKVTPTEAVPLSDITIEGNDLDHVKTVRLWNDEGSLDISKEAFKLQKSDSIIVKVPEDAPIGKISVITDADKVITWLNGMSDKLITITDVTPTVVAEGDEITLYGTNFDLVKAVRLSKGENNVIIPKADFTSVSLEDNTIVLNIPIGTPIEKVSVITDYDQIVFWEGSLSERVFKVKELSPASGSTVMQNAIITVIAENLDLVKSVLFDSNMAEYTIEEDTLTVTVPMVAEGNYTLKVTTNKGITDLGSYKVASLSYVFFDFNDGSKNSWWGQVNVNNAVGNLWEGVENDPALSLDGTPYAHVNNGGGMFFRNGANNMNLYNVTLTDWVVQFDVRVISGSGAIRLELQSATDNVQYMAPVNLADIGGWYTVTVPFSAFKDNWGSGTNSLPDLNINEFGATDGGGGNTMDLLIDNVRFAPKQMDDTYVFFDFNDGSKNSWWGQVNVNNAVGNLWEGVENDPERSLDGTPYAHVNNGSGMFFRNGANNMNLSGVTRTGWVVKFDVQVLSGDGNIRLELQSGGTQYMAPVALSGGIDKWYTVAVPFSAFTDNWGSGTNSIPDLTIDEFGATDGGNGNTMDLLIDNVRFEPK
jgi:hypothetical protein